MNALVRLTLLLATAALAVPATASAADYYVAPAGSGTTATGCAKAAPCPTIHAAVLAAQTSSAADTVHVAGGFYAVPDDALFGAADTNLTVAGEGNSTEIQASAAATGVRANQGANVTLRDLQVHAPVNAAQIAVFVGSQSTLHLERVTVSVASSNRGTDHHAISVGTNGTATLDSVTATVNTKGQVLENRGATTVRNSTLTQNNADLTSNVVRALGGQLTIQNSRLNQTAVTAGNAVVLAQTTAVDQQVGLRFDDDVITGGDATFYTAATNTGATITLALNNNTLVPRLTTNLLIADGSVVANAVNLALNSNIVRANMPAVSNVVSSSCTYNDFPVGVTPGYTCTNTSNSAASALFAAGGFDLAPGSAAIDSGRSRRDRGRARDRLPRPPAPVALGRRLRRRPARPRRLRAAEQRQRARRSRSPGPALRPPARP